LLSFAISLITAMRPRLLNATAPEVTARIRSAELAIALTSTSMPSSLKNPLSTATMTGT